MRWEGRSALMHGWAEKRAAADGVEWVGDEAGDDGGGLRDGKLGKKAEKALVLLERVLLLERVENAEVRAAVGDNADNLRPAQKFSSARGGVALRVDT
eukprot:6210649-Pleurochrysis_carterae.AAC.4